LVSAGIPRPSRRFFFGIRSSTLPYKTVSTTAMRSGLLSAPGDVTVIVPE
jgi:hypothetical protein